VNFVADFLLEPFRHDFMRRALAAAALLGLGGGLLGPFLVLRRMALMGDALSHSLLPGIALAWLLFGPTPAALFAGALLVGLLTALGGAAVSRLTVVKEDAAFGALFLLFFAAGIALAVRLPTRVHLSHFLLGNLLGVSSADLALVASVVASTALALLLLLRPLLLESFDPVFHRATGGPGRLVHAAFLGLVVLNLVAGLQTMGVVLVLGLFLLPAVAARLWCENLGPLLALSSAFAVIGAPAGLLLSYHVGLPSGPAIVLALGAILLLSLLAAPGPGMLPRALARLRSVGRVRRGAE
jgi:zinc/manganese transport system permease protein